jgi:hypothetical protein
LVAEAAAIQPQISEPFPGFDAAAVVDPSGTYEWVSRPGNTSIQNRLVITRSDDGKLAGTLDVVREGAEPTTSEIRDPELQGNKLIFDVVSRFRDREFMVTYQGIVSEKQLRGWSQMNFGGQARDNPWTADRVEKH